jgi:hypothetical protein
MPRRSTIAYLVGAGLCVDADLPHSVRLAEKLKEYLEQEAATARNTDAQAQRALLYFLIGGIRYQWARVGLDPDQPINIEQIATAALRLENRIRDPLAPYVASWSEKITEFEATTDTIFARFCDLIFARLKEWLKTPPKEKIEYISRIGDLHDEQARVSIFSLNYDLVVETAFANAGRELVNGFKDGRWNSQLLKDGAKARLYKLHGSLDWVDDEMHGICSLVFDRHPNAEDFEINKLPLLIFGTDAKLSGRDPFLTLVHGFSEQLRVADVLVCIGYSFTDTYVNEIIEQRMRENLSMRLVLVCPNAEKLKASRIFLENNPRVIAISSTALAALNDGTVRNQVMELIGETKQEMPF